MCRCDGANLRLLYERDVSKDCASRAPALFGNCREPHLTLTIRPMDDEVVRGSHLRRQREIGGFSIRALAYATHLSPTRIRQVEEAERVTPRSIGRYLDGIAEAWRARAEETAIEETAVRS